MEHLVTVLIVVLVLGVSTTFWTATGIGRVTWAAVRRRRPGPVVAPTPSPSQVAILVAAHNEELVIADTIRSAASLVPVANVHVISDGSSDTTATVARTLGASVLELNPNRGKAGALAAGIEHFGLDRHFEVVMLLDADTHLAPDYLATGLPMFADPEVVAVAGRARSILFPASPTRIGRFLVAYRERLYIAVQLLMKYGQAARWANAVAIVPGFASMYRARVLSQIDITAPGLVIEDFNMTFEVHARRLGRIAFHPAAAVAYTQDPDNYDEYVRQMRRWILGFWQTVRRHRFRFDVFWFALGLFIVELIVSGVMWALLPVLVLVVAMNVAAALIGVSWADWSDAVIAPHDLLLGVLLPDLALTLLAAVSLRQPRFLLLGLAFPVMRVVDACICLRALPRAWRAHSTGTWRSPARRSVAVVGTLSAPAPVGAPGTPRARAVDLVHTVDGGHDLHAPVAVVVQPPAWLAGARHRAPAGRPSRPPNRPPPGSIRP